MDNLLPESADKESQEVRLAKDIENGNGCSVKLLLDSLPHIEDRLSEFQKIKEQHSQLYPDSRVIFQSGVPYRGDTVEMKISGVQIRETPGLIWGTNSYSSWNDIFHDQWHPVTSKRTGNCLDLHKDQHPEPEVSE